MTRHLTLTILMVAALAMPALGGGEDGQPIVDIVVRGNEALSNSAVLHHVRSRIGQRFDANVVNQDEQRLLATGRFRSVRAYATQTDGGVVLTFEVSERATIDEIQFVNNKAFDDKKLHRDIPHSAGDPLSEFTVEAGRKAILKKYRDAGYQFAQVTSRINGRNVIYEISEGPKVAVRAVKFEGNTHFSAAKLKRTIGTNATFWPMTKNALDEEQIQQDIQAIRRLYVEDGFLGAEVSRRLQYNEEKTEVTVFFIIAEHDRFKISEIRFEGNVVFTDQQLTERLEVVAGDFLVANEVRQDQKRLQDTYGQVGYIEATIESKTLYVDPTTAPPDWIAVREGEGLVILVFRIIEEDQYHIGQIEIRGNTITQERVVRRELRFYPEQLYDAVAIRRAEGRLRDTRLFERVTIVPLAKTDHTRDVLVEVKEGDTGQLLLGAGISTNSGLLGNISFVQRNFDLFNWRRDGKGPMLRGGGQRLSVVAEPGTEMMRFHVEWFEPYLFDQPYSLGVKMFLFTRDWESYDELRAGPVVSLGHRFANDWYGEVSTRVEYVDVGSVDTGAPPDVKADEGSHGQVGFKGALIKDRTDSRWMPTTGDRMLFSFEQVVGTSTFGVLIGEYRIYRTVYTDSLDRKHVLSGRGKIGQILGDAPVFERFYAGGIGSIRGFEYRGAGPRGGTSNDPFGGDFLILVGTEYGFPIYGKMLRGVVFLDTGTVNTTTSLNSYRASIGAGLRWVIPMMGPVPISLDFAVPLVKNSGDETQVFSFFIGWTF